MATIQELQRRIPGALTVPEIEAYGDEGSVRTIKLADVTKVGQDEEEKPTLSFIGDAKVLVINKTRGQQLADLFGAGVDPVGQKVKLVVRNTPVGNRRIMMINIEEV